MDASFLSSPSSSSGSLASMDDLEAVPLCRWWGTYRPPARFFFEDVSDDEPHHFLDTCFLCKKPLVGNGDIFMYRGDTPFCSEACREEQIEIDEAREKNMKIAVKKEQQQQQQKKKKPSTSSKSERIHVRAGAVVAG